MSDLPDKFDFGPISDAEVPTGPPEPEAPAPPEDLWEDDPDVESLLAEAVPDGEAAEFFQAEEEAQKPSTKDRIRQLHGKWKAAQEAKDAAEKALQDAQNALQEAQSAPPDDETSREFKALYGQFAEPLAQLKEDAAFMDTLTEHKDNPIVRRAINFIHAQQETPMGDPNTRTPQQQQQQPEQPAAPDPAVAAMAKRLVTNDVQTALEPLGVKPYFQQRVVEHLLTNGADVGSMSPETIKNEAAAYFRAQGLTPEDVGGVPAKRNPSTATRGKAATADAPAAPQEGERDRPKNRLEAIQRHEQRLQSFLVDVSN